MKTSKNLESIGVENEQKNYIFNTYFAIYCPESFSRAAVNNIECATIFHRFKFVDHYLFYVLAWEYGWLEMIGETGRDGE